VLGAANVSDVKGLLLNVETVVVPVDMDEIVVLEDE
jgi:hypothetical protein